MKHNKYKTTKAELDKINLLAVEEINLYISGVDNPILFVLQVHLYSENLLERYIIAELPKGKKLVDKGRLTYFQKVQVVSSFGTVDNQLLASLVEFNKVRNSLAHNLDHEFNHEQLKRFSLPLGKISVEFSERAGGCLIEELRLNLNYLVSKLAGYTITIENLLK